MSWAVGLAVLLAFFAGVVVGVVLVFAVGWKLGKAATAQVREEVEKPRAPARNDVSLN